MNHLEIEYKTLLTKDEYNRLAVLFSHVTPVTQTNYYIDTPQGDMRNKRLSLRIRTLPTHGELTLKIPEKVGNMEYNVTMDCSEAKAMTKSLDFPECQIKSILLERGVKLEDLTILGHLTTTRREYQTNIGLMALDVNVYADKTMSLSWKFQMLREVKTTFMPFLRKIILTLSMPRVRLHVL